MNGLQKRQEGPIALGLPISDCEIPGGLGEVAGEDEIEERKELNRDEMS